MHEVFIKLLEDPRRLHGEASPATWMYRVATRLCIDRPRKRSRRARLILADNTMVPESRGFARP